MFVTVYYFYVQDAEFGPGFIKTGTYAPYPVKVCLNGHQWAKQQLRRAGIAFQSPDNGFLSCADPVRLQATCQQLGPEQVQAFFDKWVAHLPWPLTPEDRVAGYQHRLSIWQMEVSRTQVFTRPACGHEFFEHVIRENLDLSSRPGTTDLRTVGVPQHPQPLLHTCHTGWRSTQRAAAPMSDPHLSAQVAPGALLLALLVAVSGGALAGWLSARRAAALKPSQTLRDA